METTFLELTQPSMKMFTACLWQSRKLHSSWRIGDSFGFKYLLSDLEMRASKVLMSHLGESFVVFSLSLQHATNGHGYEIFFGLD